MMSPRTSSRLSSSKDTNTLEPKLKDKFCFFCKKTEPRTLRLTLFFNLDRKVRACANVLQDFGLLAKLSTDGDMITQEAMYHPACLLAYYHKAKSARVENVAVNNEEIEPVPYLLN